MRALLGLLVLTLLSPIIQALPQWSHSRNREILTPSAVSGACAGNTAGNRGTWCEFDLDTDYYNDGPNTGVIKEFWFELVNTTLAPDGVERIALTVNGTIPGPTIEVNWGDTVVVHVLNSLENNGSSIHFHGVRQNGTNQNDGVTSITQCPIAPGSTYTYTWRAEQYGTSWYHSHYSLQAWEGVFGPIIIHGPATSDYDIDLGVVALSDWDHQTANELYHIAQTRGPPTLNNGLINGVNKWGNGGSRWETTFTPGKKHLMRILNTAIDTHFTFAIDGHKMTVISTDFVPIVPYETDVLQVAIAQRYDVIVEADAPDAHYWMRAVPQDCSSNNSTDNIRAIVKYEGASARGDPKSEPYNMTLGCFDEDLSQLIPYMHAEVGSAAVSDDWSVQVKLNSDNLFKWYLDSNTMVLDWENPTLMQVWKNATQFTNTSCIYELDVPDEWAYFVISTTNPIPHPMHLHGHDFYVLAQGTGTYSGQALLQNPPRRDTALLPGNGYLMIAFPTDNIGVWLLHCHIGWHAADGLASQFIERASEMTPLIDDTILSETCAAWQTWNDVANLADGDSGI
ncbi:MAG: hypothetical protein M1834_000731 [Cirrosporium novae-zelandiae]|nr:MAG: hypothetical protein M1834_000731 [Cirrosporium novae-zelandiae]